MFTEPLQEIKISLPMPLFNTSLFSDKVELEDNVYNLYSNIEERFASVLGTNISADKSEILSTGSPNKALATLHQSTEKSSDMSTLKESLDRHSFNSAHSEALETTDPTPLGRCQLEIPDDSNCDGKKPSLSEEATDQCSTLEDSSEKESHSQLSGTDGYTPEGYLIASEASHQVPTDRESSVDTNKPKSAQTKASMAEWNEEPLTFPNRFSVPIENKKDDSSLGYSTWNGKDAIHYESQNTEKHFFSTTEKTIKKKGSIPWLL
ncbi:hypothetical protein BY458DRAFT_518661 [Sporodiniella umbellata]|nr:hypothetical protein BY458DRAFT_518661 [Sporodiniella umbellata]